MSTELLAAVGVTGAFWAGALYGARLTRHAATQDLSEALSEADQAHDDFLAMVRLNMRLHRERRPWGVVDAHAWPDNALGRLRADIARWDGVELFDQDREEGCT